MAIEAIAIYNNCQGLIYNSLLKISWALNTFYFSKLLHLNNIYLKTKMEATKDTTFIINFNWIPHMCKMFLNVFTNATFFVVFSFTNHLPHTPPSTSTHTHTHFFPGNFLCSMLVSVVKIKYANKKKSKKKSLLFFYRFPFHMFLLLQDFNMK